MLLVEKCSHIPALRPFQSLSENQTEIPLARELPYWDFMDDLVVLADGSLVIGLKLKGVSIETWDTDAVNRFTASLRAILNGLPDSCEVSFMSQANSDYADVIGRHEAMKSGSSLVDWVSGARIARLRDDEATGALRRISLHAFVYRRYDGDISVRGGAVMSAIKGFFAPPARFREAKRKEHIAAERELRQVVDNLRAGLDAVGVKSEPLAGASAWQMIYRFLNPRRSVDNPAPRLNIACSEQEFNSSELEKVPELVLASPREQLVFSDMVQGYDSFFLDGLYHRIVTLKTLPEFTHSALVSRLMGLPFGHVLHVHLRVPEQSKELSALQTKRRMAHSMSISQGGRATDLESEARLQSTEELLREIIATGQKIFYFQAGILLRAESKDELDSQTKMVLGRIREMNGAEGLAETVAGFKVWKTLMPLGTTTLVRGKRVKTDNLADFLPVYSPYDGGAAAPVCLFRSREQGLVRYDPFDPSLPNYNALVTGSSGAGKSFLNNLVLLQYMTERPLVYVIDIGGSYRKLCEFLGGQYVEITPPKSGETCKTINPFALPVGVKEPSPQKIKFLLALLENILTDEEGDKLPKLDKSLIEEMIGQVYGAGPEKNPCLSDFAKVLAGAEEPRVRDYGKMLYPWTGDRPYGRLLDGENTFDVTADFVVFDLKGLSSYPDLQSVIILIITDFILGRIEGRGDGDAAAGRRKRIVMDECWELLKSRASSQFMEYCVRTLRKTGAGITFITQGLEEIVASPIGAAILSNTATKFILLQRGDLEPIRKILKFNDQEMALIGSLRQAKGVYSEAFLMANEARAVIQAHPAPVEYWLATSDAADNAAIEDAGRANPDKALAEVIHELAEAYPCGITQSKKGESTCA